MSIERKKKKNVLDSTPVVLLGELPRMLTPPSRPPARLTRVGAPSAVERGPNTSTASPDMCKSGH